jgi:hypothetical protein
MSLILEAEEKILTDYLQKGARITKMYYASLIAKLRDAIKKKRRGKLKRGVLFHQNNATLRVLQRLLFPRLTSN